METPEYVVPILVMGFRCLRCEHEWVPRSTRGRLHALADEPKVCPRCKSPYWTTRRTERVTPSRPKARTVSEIANRGAAG